MKKKFYITTSIAYVNAPPHIGFALELVQADVVARYHRLLGDDVFFLTGTDEHGLKNARKAKEQGLAPQQFVDQNAAKFKDLCARLHISNNEFIRTTDKTKHYPGVLRAWRAFVANGDLYQKEYQGWYCSGCEKFITEKELVNGLCTLHQKAPEQVKEQNYFFKLTKYAQRVKIALQNKELEIIPNARANEIISFIEQGVEDISFSRSAQTLSWGV